MRFDTYEKCVQPWLRTQRILDPKWFVIVGGAAMARHGLRDCDDIDLVAASPGAWQMIVNTLQVTAARQGTPKPQVAPSYFRGGSQRIEVAGASQEYPKIEAFSALCLCGYDRSYPTQLAAASFEDADGVRWQTEASLLAMKAAMVGDLNAGDVCARDVDVDDVRLLERSLS